MCCGQKRTELRNKQAQRAGRAVPQYVSGNSPPPMHTPSPLPPAENQIRNTQPEVAAPVAVARSFVRVRFLENSPIRVRGPVSGLTYEFSGSHPVQQVDHRDAPSLLKTRFFRGA
jgi:hypothetical protein